MQRLLIYSNEYEQIELVRSTLEKHLNNHIDICMDQRGLRMQMESYNYAIAIFRTFRADQNTLDIIKKVRTLGYSLPLMLANDEVSAEARRFISGLTDVHTLIAPYSERALVGLTRKLMLARRVPRQAFRRFNTNLMAQIEPMSSGNQVLTSMYNLSKGGAYCEFESPERLTVGDLIKLRINLEDTKSDYDLSAKVVWTTKKGRFSGRFGCGFKFVSTEDAYHALMSKL